ncbi:hypothetical protein HYC85_001791 [Camellia sinensis]|uniref:Uncharacterized protein n=1 Tax=Camellia sinensis TaxID=4442 RepID=A0A7J7I6D0_CAMSI|nr:hypothetical protein HYC85_001791 [Camellia sinensis]
MPNNKENSTNQDYRNRNTTSWPRVKQSVARIMKLICSSTLAYKRTQQSMSGFENGIKTILLTACCTKTTIQVAQKKKKKLTKKHKRQRV